MIKAMPHLKKRLRMPRARPVIIVGFNDRTVNVYLAATSQVIPLDAARPTLDEVNSRTLVYSRTL